MVHLLDLGVDVAVLADSIGAQLASCKTVVFWAADFLYVDARLANAVLIHGLRNSVLWCGQLELGTPPSSVHIDRNTTHWATSSSCRYRTSIPFAHRLTWRPKYTTGRRDIGVVHGKGLKNLAQPRPSKWKDPLLVQIPGSPGRGPLPPQRSPLRSTCRCPCPQRSPRQRPGGRNASSPCTNHQDVEDGASPITA